MKTLEERNAENYQLGLPREFSDITEGITRSKEKDDGVCDGEYVHPTQGEIIAFNRGENQGILRSMELLEKLKDFYYWKEWKNK